jgi:hypothetical protein
MVKFNQRLNANVVPEWATHYLAYAALKKRITLDGRRAPSACESGVPPLDAMRRALLADEARGIDGFEPPSFEEALLAEVAKIERFYQKRLRHATEEWETQVCAGAARARALAVLHAHARSARGPAHSIHTRTPHLQAKLCLCNATIVRLCAVAACSEIALRFKPSAAPPPSASVRPPPPARTAPAAPAARRARRRGRWRRQRPARRGARRGRGGARAGRGVGARPLSHAHAAAQF